MSAARVVGVWPSVTCAQRALTSSSLPCTSASHLISSGCPLPLLAAGPARGRVFSSCASRTATCFAAALRMVAFGICAMTAALACF